MSRREFVTHGMRRHARRDALYLCEPENDFIDGQPPTVDGGATVQRIYPE